MHKNNLTETTDWEKLWRSHNLPQVIKTKYNPYYVDVLDRFFYKYLPKNGQTKLLELGCAPGRFLHYFYKEFGYEVYGLDNEPFGVQLTLRNLEILQVPAKIFLGDALDFNIDQKFDILCSFGLIEHFDPAESIISKHLNLLNPNGLLVVEVPNLASPLYLNLQKLIDKSYIKQHKLYDVKNFRDLFSSQPLEIIYCGYLGVMSLHMLRILPNQKIASWFVSRTQNVIDKIFRLIEYRRESRWLSPYIYLVARKINEIT